MLKTYTQRRGANDDSGRRGSGARAATPRCSSAPGTRPRGRRPRPASAGPRDDTFWGLLAFKSRFFATAPLPLPLLSPPRPMPPSLSEQEVGEERRGEGGAAASDTRTRGRWPADRPAGRAAELGRASGAMTTVGHKQPCARSPPSPVRPS